MPEMDTSLGSADGAEETELESAQSPLFPGQATRARRSCLGSRKSLAVTSALFVCSLIGAAYRDALLHRRTPSRSDAHRNLFLMKNSDLAAGSPHGTSIDPEPPMLPPWLPEMYGKVQEKTIWAYWYHPETCPHAANCTLPPHIQLCVETVEKHKGSFDYKILHIDEVDKYVSNTDLPVLWQQQRPQQQKDSLMNALLARYGGVAIDMSLILFHSLDEYWDEMVGRGATFWGYMYRLHGMPWAHAETCAVWFLMSRREGIFSTVTSHQVSAMAGMAVQGMAASYKRPGEWAWGWRAFGDQMLTPVLSMFNYSLPKCYDDPSVPVREACPEYAAPSWSSGLSGPPRTDSRLMLREPREGPQLPTEVEPTWHVDNSTELREPPAECSSMESCWEIFLQHYRAPAANGTTRVVNFVKMFSSGGSLWNLSREELCADKATYFYNWLKLAGLEGC
mmetsp:Transcript_27742/g.57615  ORF Transcript_27742/g.57615 Transcript_27742/m.57615 type:complete len:450 (+) Transcript_27742:2-1351(+)